eukprot:1924162-Amphidinium_carterae.1
MHGVFGALAFVEFTTVAGSAWVHSMRSLVKVGAWLLKRGCVAHTCGVLHGATDKQDCLWHDLNSTMRTTRV